LELTQQVESIAKPTVRYNEIEVHSYNSRAYFAGKHEWEAVEMVLKDDVTNSVTSLVTHQIQKQLNHFEQTSFESGINYKFLTYIETMDGGNDNVLDAWILEGCMLTNVKFAQLDYSTNEYQKITLTIRFDNATMTGGLETATPELIPGVTVG
jgi:hypothetical protein